MPTASPSATESPALTPAPTTEPTAAPTPAGRFSLTGRKVVSDRVDFTATLLPDGRVLIVGGRSPSEEFGGYLASAELYDPTTGTFSPTGSMSTERIEHTATLLRDGRVLVAGGHNNESYFSSAELYDPETGTFSPTGSMATDRYGHSATLLPDGRVLIAGKYNDASAELYDPTTGTFSPTGSMVAPRIYHTATLLADGRVLIVGGRAGNIAENPRLFASAELYDPKTGRFRPTGSMSRPRSSFMSGPDYTATLLSDGRVLIAGGWADSSNKPLNSAELYDPKTGTFSLAVPMLAARRDHSATRLQDGRVLMVGGDADLSAELYDATSGIFTAAGLMTTGGGTATLLLDGRVLIVGGGSVAELYTP
jgi:hypothetical protein